MGLFQVINQTNRGLRLYNQARLRAFTAEHPEVEVFCAHNPWELEAAQRTPAGATMSGPRLAVAA